MNQNPRLKNSQKNPFRNDIKRQVKNEIEISQDLNPDNLAIGEIPIMGGLKTKKLTQIGEEMLIDQYSKRKKK